MAIIGMSKSGKCTKIFSAVLLLAIQCNQKAPEISGEGIKVGSTGAVTITDPALMPVEQRFLSADKSGKWAEQKGNHVPLVEASRDNFSKVWTIRASVPFIGNDQHYIEHIILVNHRTVELQKKNLGRGTPNASAMFSYKEKDGEKLYILARCNMHDVWVSPVIESEKK